MMWCPNGECTNRDWYFRLNVFITHYLPAYVLDMINHMTGKRAKMVLHILQIPESTTIT